MLQYSLGARVCKYIFLLKSYAETISINWFLYYVFFAIKLRTSKTYAYIFNNNNCFKILPLLE